ncbi:hypothetical protein GCM10025857_04750 [Alicyclobacillus contaminans]|nr:hypothetical protein GCM10025857_04750 [Alicyclobacillus contaminans]
MVVNDVTEAGAGFGVDTNRVTLVRRNGADVVLPLMSKFEVANALLDQVVDVLHRKPAAAQERD